MPPGKVRMEYPQARTGVPLLGQDWGTPNPARSGCGTPGPDQDGIPPARSGSGTPSEDRTGVPPYVRMEYPPGQNWVPPPQDRTAKQALATRGWYASCVHFLVFHYFHCNSNKYVSFYTFLQPIFVFSLSSTI